LGHLPNKARKEAERALIEERRRRDSKPTPPLPRCLCGLTYLEVPIMWAFTEGRGEMEIFCPACLPAKHFRTVMTQVAQLPSDE
jgi:hypothetical protein